MATPISNLSYSYELDGDGEGNEFDVEQLDDMSDRSGQEKKVHVIDVREAKSDEDHFIDMLLT